jgi:hypothetical protein
MSAVHAICIWPINVHGHWACPSPIGLENHQGCVFERPFRSDCIVGTGEFDMWRSARAAEVLAKSMLGLTIRPFVRLATRGLGTGVSWASCSFEKLVYLNRFEVYM